MDDLVLIHRLQYDIADLKAKGLFRFSRRPGLRRSTLRLLQQTGRTRRRANIFAYGLDKYWNPLQCAVSSEPGQHALNVHLPIAMNFSPNVIFLGSLSFPDH